MAKNIFATLGILVVLLLSLGMISAASENGFEITVTGVGSTSDNRISGNPGETVTFSVQFNNSNLSHQDVSMVLSGTDITPDELSISGNETFNLFFTIPTTQATTYRILSGVVNSSGNTVGEISDSVYYTVSGSEIPGCMDSTATNYNSDATTDDGSCIYESSDTFCELSGFGNEAGHLEITEIDIENNGAGDDEEWEYLDELKIEVTIENTDDENINDVMVELIIKDNSGNDVTNDFDLDDDKVDLGKMNFLIII